MLNFGHTEPFTRAFDGPFQRFGQSLTQDQPAGLADGRQAHVSPVLRTVVLQLTHQSGVRQNDELHVPGLAHAVPELTLAHAQMLLPVPMEGLSSCPAFAIGLENTVHFPIGSIGDQNLARLVGAFRIPQHYDPHWMADFRQTDALGEVPLCASADRALLATSR